MNMICHKVTSNHGTSVVLVYSMPAAAVSNSKAPGCVGGASCSAAVVVGRRSVEAGRQVRHRCLRLPTAHQRRLCCAAIHLHTTVDIHDSDSLLMVFIATVALIICTAVCF